MRKRNLSAGILAAVFLSASLYGQSGTVVTITTADGLDMQGTLICVTDSLIVIDSSCQDWSAVINPSLDALQGLPLHSLARVHADGHSNSGNGILIGAGAGIALGVIKCLSTNKGFFKDAPVYVFALPLGLIGGLLGAMIGGSTGTDEVDVIISGPQDALSLRELAVYGDAFPPHIRQALIRTQP